MSKIFRCLTCKKEFTKPNHPNHAFKYCSRSCMGKNEDRIRLHALKIGGHIPWNKGLKGIMKSNSGSFKKGQRASKQTEFKKGNISEKPFEKGHVSWSKGKKLVKISRRNEDDKKMRMLFRTRMQKRIFERDNYTCKICGLRGVDLQIDHIKSWARHPSLRFKVDNCRTLCAKCHYSITFGRKMPEKVSGWGHNLFGGRQI